jgi:hypothetical protein
MTLALLYVRNEWTHTHWIIPSFILASLFLRNDKLTVGSFASATSYYSFWYLSTEVRNSCFLCYYIVLGLLLVWELLLKLWQNNCLGCHCLKYHTFVAWAVTAWTTKHFSFHYLLLALSHKDRLCTYCLNYHNCLLSSYCLNYQTLLVLLFAACAVT